jgi:hypothetical protein
VDRFDAETETPQYAVGLMMAWRLSVRWGVLNGLCGSVPFSDGGEGGEGGVVGFGEGVEVFLGGGDAGVSEAFGSAARTGDRFG